MDSSAAIGTSTARRTAASSSTVAQGCSTYSSPPAALSSEPIALTASSTDQAPLASTRSRPDGPRASRTASTRAWSSASDWPGSATFTLAVAQPPPRTISCACSGPDRRHRDVDRHHLADGRRPVAGGSLLGTAQPGFGDRWLVLQERAPLAPPGLAAQQHPLADGDAAEPVAQRDREHPGLGHGPNLGCVSRFDQPGLVGADHHLQVGPVAERRRPRPALTGRVSRPVDMTGRRR